jgi:uncharacterized protein YyaL (SSP411 family)
MEATQALTGQGGWPMSVFLTPDGKPFYAGTYFPPTPRHGLPSFAEVLGAISEAWQERRSDLLDSASEIARQLATPTALPGADKLSATDCQKALLALQTDFDAVHGGFGRAPKFPPSMVLEALLRDGGRVQMAGRTLEAMARGGIYDQVGGGFALQRRRGLGSAAFREDAVRQRVASGGVHAWWRRTRNPLAERIVTQTIAWLLREMRTEQGAFAASLDADSKDDHGVLREGAYYVWNRDQLRSALGEKTQPEPKFLRHRPARSSMVPRPCSCCPI